MIKEEAIDNDLTVEETTCEGMDLTADEGDILDQIRQSVDRGESCDGIAFKRVDGKKLKIVTERANRVIQYIGTEDITETNNLIVATSVLIAKEFGLKKHVKGVKKQEPWWKRRIKESINELRRHVNNELVKRSKKGNFISNGRIKAKVAGKGLKTEEI